MWHQHVNNLPTGINSSVSAVNMSSYSFQQILESAHKTIESSIMFIDGELKDNTEVLELLLKKKKPKIHTKMQQQELPKSMNVSLFVPFVSENNTVLFIVMH